MFYWVVQHIMVQALLKHFVYCWDFILGKYANYTDFDKNHLKIFFSETKLNENLAGMVFERSPFKIISDSPELPPRCPQILKIEISSNAIF